MIVETTCAIGRHSGDSRSDRDDVAVVGSAMLAVAERHQPFHELTPPAKDAQWKAAAHGLAERAKVRGYAQILLRAARRHAKRTQHFVENQQSTVLFWKAGQRMQEIGSGQHTPGVVVDWLTNHGGNVAAVLLKRRFEQIGPVVRDYHEI